MTDMVQSQKSRSNPQIILNAKYPTTMTTATTATVIVRALVFLTRSGVGVRTNIPSKRYMDLAAEQGDCRKQAITLVTLWLRVQ